MKPKTSPIWNYFVEVDGSTVRCKLCGKLYSRKGRTTTALKSHIRAMHAEEFADFEKLDEALKLTQETKKQEVPTTTEFVALNSPQMTPSPNKRSVEQRSFASNDSHLPQINVQRPADMPRVSVAKGARSAGLVVKRPNRQKMGDKWGVDKIIKFLEEYKKHECLWDIRNGLYKNRQARDASYQIISQEMSNIFGTDMTVKAVKDKIRSLRNTYLTEVKKIIESKRAGSEHVYEPKLKWFQAMEFLRNVEELRQAQYNNIAEVGNNADYSGDASPSNKFSEHSSNHKRRRHSTSMSSRFEEDEFDVFGRNVSLQLKKLPLAYALESQELIQRVLKEQRIKAMKEETSQIEKSPHDAYLPKTPRSTVTRIESTPSPSEPCLVICENNDLIKLENCDDIY